jgi:hypothetical protein
MLKYEGMFGLVLYIPVHVLGLSWKCQKQRIRATNRKARGRSAHDCLWIGPFFMYMESKTGARCRPSSAFNRTCRRP